MTGPCPKEIENIITLMRQAHLDITEEGTLEDFLGVNINRQPDGTIHLTQPHLIESIFKDLILLGPGVSTKTTPMSSSCILQRHATSQVFDKSFDHRSVIGKMNYLERGSRSDISYAVYQCARFSLSPKQQYGEAVK